MSLTVENINLWMGELRNREARVYIPKFKIISTFNLKNTLVSMGMIDAFGEDNANFAGMDGKPDALYIDDAIHKAFVEVNEEGTEAAAATGVIIGRTTVSLHSPPPPQVFRADRPFIVLIQDKLTDSILFLGRVADPTKTGE